MYQVEELICEDIRNAIGEYLSMDKKFIPFFTEAESGELIVVADIYKKTPYSKALSDLLDLVAQQYETFKGAN